MPKIASAAEAVAHIADAAVVAVNSSSGLCCPDAVLEALGARFRTEGKPGKLTMVHPIAAGDMFGTKGVDHLAQEGMIDTIIGGSYPSGPSSSEPPLIWQLLGANKLAAYNVPSGILFDILREAAGLRPGVLTKVGLETFVDPDLDGCAMNERARGKPLQAGNLPPAEEFARYVDTFQLDNWIAFPDSAPEGAPLREGTWGGIWDLDDAYYFRIRSSLRLTPADPPVDFRSREFEEIFPGESYRGQMYLLEVKAGEIKLFNFYNAVLEAFFSNGLTTAPRVLRNAVGEYGFAISKKAFGRPLEELIINE